MLRDTIQFIDDPRLLPGAPARDGRRDRRAARRHAAQGYRPGGAAEEHARKRTTSSSAWTTSRADGRLRHSLPTSTSPGSSSSCSGWRSRQADGGALLRRHQPLDRGRLSSPPARSTRAATRWRSRASFAAPRRRRRPISRIVSLADRHARPRRPHGRGDRRDRARRDGLRGQAVPARSGIVQSFLLALCRQLRSIGRRPNFARPRGLPGGRYCKQQENNRRLAIAEALSGGRWATARDDGADHAARTMRRGPFQHDRRGAAERA